MGSYSWRDGIGVRRVYIYMADSQGYRVKEMRMEETENHVDDMSNDKRDSDIIDSREKSSMLRPKRKVLVRVPKRRGRVIGKVIAYQPEVHWNRKEGALRLMGENQLVTVKEGERKIDESVDENEVNILPISVLLKKVKVIRNENTLTDNPRKKIKRIKRKKKV